MRATAGSIVARARSRTTQSIGIEVFGGKAVALIGVGSWTPVARTMTFTTVADGQRAIEVRVVRCLTGRRAGPAIGRFVLAGMRPAPRGDARIDIGLSLDREGVLHAWGTDRSTGAHEEAFFSGAWALSPEARADALNALESSLAGEEGFPELRGIVGVTMPAADRETALATIAGEIAFSRRTIPERPLLIPEGDVHAS